VSSHVRVYAGVSDPSSFAMARKICCIIGEYFQVQDDFLDCYADPEVLGELLLSKQNCIML
jgi:farnesyl diphosphate synthase